MRRGEWLHADGTTLGADNGVGVAAALALLDLPCTAKLPPLECLFTVDVSARAPPHPALPLPALVHGT